MLNVMLNDEYYVECYAEFYGECYYAECRYAECHYAECCGAISGIKKTERETIKLRFVLFFLLAQFLTTVFSCPRHKCLQR
jgi:hypothetical protein